MFFAVNQNNTNFAMQTASRSPVGSCGQDARHFVKAFLDILKNQLISIFDDNVNFYIQKSIIKSDTEYI